MNQQDNDKPTVIEDLLVDDARQDEVKGGSPRIAGGGALENLAGSHTW